MDAVNSNLVTPRPEDEMSSLGFLIGEAFELYKELFVKLITLGFLSLLAIAPLYLAVGGSIALVGANFAVAKFTIYAIAGILILAGLIVSVYSGAAVQAAILLLFKNGNSSIKELFERGQKIALGYIVVALLTALIVFGWTLLLVIPGIIFSIYYSYSQFAYVYEGKTGMQALRRSKQLVTNHWWSVLLRMLVVGGLFAVVSLVFDMVSQVMTEGTNLFILWNFLSVVVRFVLSPFITIYTFLIFEDLVRIKGKDSNAD